jgi:DNA polymerase-3 subunit epsilon
MFTLPPKDTENVIHFNDNEHKLNKLYEWGLITETARHKQIIKEFEYCGIGMEAPSLCDVIGYIPYNDEPDSPDTALIIVDGQLHKVMPAYLKEMQKGNTKTLEDNPVKKPKIVKGTKDVTVQNKGDFDFVAIDFETANNELSSACSIGIAAVNNNEIALKKYYLIKPPGLKFDKKNTEIHGLTAEDVMNAADFSSVWPEIAPYIANNLLVAHNAAFDMSVLKCCLAEYNLAVPNTEYVCSIAVSDYAFPETVGKSLAERASLLGINLENAHNALDDAAACAELVIKTLKINAQNSLQAFLPKKRKIKRSLLSEFKHMTAFQKPKKNYNRFNQICIADIAATVDVINTENPVYEKAFVFTGEMEHISREEAMQMVVNLGGIIKSGVSKKINYLVVGIQDKSLVSSAGMSSKEIKANELIQQGIEINIINEQTFMDLIGDNHDN